MTTVFTQARVTLPRALARCGAQPQMHHVELKRDKVNSHFEVPSHLTTSSAHRSHQFPQNVYSMAPRDFHHPFEPYEIQQQFMEALYDCIENGKVGIFESPTGTGKSLSLICASLSWLREHKRRAFDEALATVPNDDDDPDWMVDHAKDMRRREIREMRTEFEARLAAARERERKIKQDHSGSQLVFKKQKRSQDRPEGGGDVEEFVLEDYDDDHDTVDTSTKPNYSSHTTELMEKLGLLSSNKPNQAEAAPEELKVYFCSRTHSQLTQLIGELRRVRLPSAFPVEPEATSFDPEDGSIQELKHLTLGARKNLCINPKVNRLSSATAINERCVELQQSKTPASQKCSFLPNKESEHLVLDFRDSALSKIRDIEDLANVGSRLQICPYYASRPAIGFAEVVTLPYPLLLQKSARQALGISLKGHVIIIDEAHNVINAIESTYSAQLSELQLKHIREALLTYLHKFRNRLKGSNRMYLAQVVRVVDSLLLFTAEVRDTVSAGDTTTAEALLAGKAVDQINLAKLVQYMSESKLARKIEGYSVFLQQSTSTGSSKAFDESYEVPPLTQFQDFLPALMNPSKEGRFLWSNVNNDVQIQYLLLDPSEHFREVVEEARAVVLAGGTMSPMEDYIDRLFPYLSSVTTFSCGHLIPPRSLFVRTVTADTQGLFNFSYSSRTEATATRLGTALLSIGKVVKGGTVVFFPSYGFLESVLRSWRNGNIKSELEKISSVFYDDRTTSTEETFKSYSDAISSHGGSLLFSVIGGKLSEGINFSDDLGRCVIVVGMPYPNLETPEWKARLRYLNEQTGLQQHGTKSRVAKEHVENICMRSVNQAIGRAIRHKNDWASILLFDARYTGTQIQAKLPGWIKTSYDPRASTQLDGVVRDLDMFFLQEREPR